jgi:hypothetical protein
MSTTSTGYIFAGMARSYRPAVAGSNVGASHARE